MVIGDRLRQLREEKKFSQGDIEKRTGLLRCYISRVENGHTVPSLETMEKFARALEVPLYQLFYDGDEPAVAPKISRSELSTEQWGHNDRSAELWHRFQSLLPKMKEHDRQLLMFVALKMARKNRV